MSLAYAILAALADRACSGYDLAKSFDASLGYFWTATHQQIYRELAQLEERQWIQGRAINQTDRPNKTLFHITPEGTTALRAWITQPSKPSKVREEILVKLFAGGLVAPAVSIAELQRLRRGHHQQLATYRRLEKTFFADPTQLALGERCQYLTLRNGIRYEQYWLDWCDEALGMLAEA